MSVNDNNNAAAPASFAAGAAPQASAAPQKRAPTSLMAQMGMTLSRNQQSESLSVAKERLTKWINDYARADGLSFAVITIDPAQYPNLRAAAVLLVALDQATKRLGYHTALLEAGSTPLDAENVNLNGLTVLNERYFEQVYSPVYATVVMDIVKKSFPTFTTVNDLGSASYFPKNFNWTVDSLVHSAAVTMLNHAICDVLHDRGDLTEINLTELGDQNRLQLRMSVGGEDTVSPVGRPQRSDLRIDVSLVSNNTGGQQSNDPNALPNSVLFARTAGFIDAIWRGPTQGGNAGWGQAQSTPQRFLTRAVVTSGESTSLQGTESVLLSTLVPVVSAMQGTNYFPYFRRGTVLPRLRDIGAINIEANLNNEPGFGTYIDTSSQQTFGDVELGKLLSAVFYPETVISVDVETLGLTRAANEVLLSAANGNEAAQQEILRAANAITGGVFRQYYKGGAAVVQNEEVILLGTWDSEIGVRDLRDFDYLAVMNQVGRGNNGVNGQPSIGTEWARCTSDSSVPLVQRLSEQRRILRGLTSNTAVFTGTARRVTYTSDFVIAFTQALKAAKINVQLLAPGQGVDYQGTRPTFNWLDQAAYGGNATAAFATQGYGNGNGNSANVGGAFVGVSRTGW